MAQQCIVCNDRSRKLYVEKNNSENVFCGKECQSVFYNRHALMTAKLIGGPFTYLMDRPDFNAGTVTAMVQRMKISDIVHVIQELLDDIVRVRKDTVVDTREKEQILRKKEQILRWIAHPLMLRSELKEYQSDLLAATMWDALELTEWLIFRMGYDPSLFDGAALGRASAEGRVNFVKLLLRDGRANPAAQDSDALKVAVENGHTEVLKLLLEDGRADPRAANGEALKLAVSRGHHKVIELLLRYERINPFKGFEKKESDGRINPLEGLGDSMRTF